ncbi:heavy metal sensor histidine kinase [Eoetvoesiella caeni]|uniref:Sensor protein n=1 Tax=Eoetvoesiella caeni TaxID=645616 RepID=A0A366HD45_9BURK|nr:heavy metal sensor histidine kinase [Eoetvoesiella caeni]MCI2809103.1 heavy metal sensor histidine kinase [Eoetvoesiella caeni]NYT55396.1 heavy metal sensor histidine kinase [Eoetvoesiella caeni]RBP39947.1 two-component system heavy metal sensor histidine kinase CusS [Eoetvoesiella caeni]
MKRSITLRLVAMFALATAIMFGLIGAALYHVLSGELARHQQEELQTIYQDMEYMIKRAGTVERWSHVQIKMDTLHEASDNVYFWADSAVPQYRYGNGLADVEGRLVRNDGTGVLDMPGHEYPLFTLTGTIPAFQDRPAVRVTIGVDSMPYVRTLQTFLTALIVLSLIAVLLVVVLGYCIARLGLRPLKKMSFEAQALNAKTLSQRLHGQLLPEELDDLAVAFNGALSRLETAYKQLEAFNADVAHELRTPLTNLIGETQVALSRPRTVTELQEVLQSNLEDLERLRSIVNDMLFLARADQGEAATGRVQSSVADEVGKTIEFLEFILDETHETIRVDGDTAAQAMIETSLFRRALANLLQNAIEHSRSGAQIKVVIERQPERIRIGVSNPGDPIASAHLPRLFDRFYRVDGARYNGRRQGHGLGLAIVKAVATMHGGEVFAYSQDGMTTIGFSVLSTSAADAAAPG